MKTPPQNPLVAIACGGTGGHLFPGLAVGEELLMMGCDVLLLISPKEVDQQAVQSSVGMEIVTLPAVGLVRKNILGFATGFWKSYWKARAEFQKRRPAAVLAMGGFTSAPPILAGRSLGAKTFLHDSNSIPGKANRWLSPRVDEAFVYFEHAKNRLRTKNVHRVGMPVRQAFRDGADAYAARMALGLKAEQPVLLVMGGSQGASGVNELVLKTLPLLAAKLPNWQYLHITGPADAEKVQAAYTAQKLRAVVKPFLTEMELALGAATVGVSRAGASSLAEMAALGLPSVLVPYPHAADNHQFFNAEGFVESGAARMIRQGQATPGELAGHIVALGTDEAVRAAMQKALTAWHYPDAAQRVAQHILKAIGAPIPETEAGPEVNRFTENQPLRKEAHV